MKLRINERDSYFGKNFQDVYDEMPDSMKDELEGILGMVETRREMLGRDARNTVDTFAVFRAKKLYNSTDDYAQRKVIRFIINKFCTDIGVRPLLLNKPL